MANTSTDRYQFSLGPPGTGAPFHFHTNALNILVYGRKRWFFKHPHNATYSNTAPLQWYRAYQSAEQGYQLSDEDARGDHVGFGVALQCVQQPGEVVLIPRDWGHAVLNVETSIGVAAEFEV